MNRIKKVYKVNPDLRGVLRISSLNYPLTANQLVTIDSNLENREDIKSLIEDKTLIYYKYIKEKISKDDSKYLKNFKDGVTYTFKNISNFNISLKSGLFINKDSILSIDSSKIDEYFLQCIKSGFIALHEPKDKIEPELDSEEDSEEDYEEENLESKIEAEVEQNTELDIESFNKKKVNTFTKKDDYEIKNGMVVYNPNDE